MVLTTPDTEAQGYYFCAYHVAMGARFTVVQADPPDLVIHAKILLQVTVAESAYFIDGNRTLEPALPAGEQIALNMSDSTVDGHPMLLADGPDGTHAGHRVLNDSDTITYFVDGLIVSQDTYMNSFDSSHADYSHRCAVAGGPV